MRMIEPQVACDVQLGVAIELARVASNFQPMVDSEEFDIGARLKALIDQSGKTQLGLAGHLGVSAQAVQKWIKQGTLAREHVRGICRYLSCSADELFGLAPVGASRPASDRQSQPLELDLEMLKSSIAATKEAYRAFEREMDAYGAAPLIAFAYRERAALPRVMSKAEYRAFDAIVTAKLRGDLEHVEQPRQPAGAGKSGAAARPTAEAATRGRKRAGAH